MTAELQRVPVEEDRKEKIARIAADLDARTDALLEIAGKTMDVNRFKRVVVIAISKNPELIECTRESIIRAILEAAQDGLEPTGPAGGAHLVPFRNRDGILEAVLIRDYRGLLKMALRGEVSDIEVNVVHEGDFLEIEMGSTPHVRFIPVRDGKDRGSYQGVYTLLRFKDRSIPEHIDYQTIADINKVRNSTRGGGKKGPWADWYDEMVIKTAVRHALKMRATTPELYEALAREDAVETAWDEPENRAIVSERRERLVSAIAPDRPGRPQPAEPAPADDDTGAVAGGPQGVSVAAVEAAEDLLGVGYAESDDLPDPAELELERDPAFCGAASPFDGQLCNLLPDHTGVHRIGDEQTWPR